MSTQTIIQAVEENAAAVERLLARRLPEAARLFRLRRAPALGADLFEISGGGDAPLTVRGGDLVAVAAGVNWYLKHFVHVHFSWCGDQLNLPRRLPRVEGTVRIRSPYRWRYYFNYCTFSYSMAFWDWSRWEREIDWMALSGINLPLAIVGQEAIWQRVYRTLGLNDEELGEFFAGPAFLAWGWMGNIDGWNGPTPQSWIDGQCQLQKNILGRMRQLGIKPVLPAFTGHVPPALIRHFPELKIRRMENWAETFPGTYLLDPTDPMFQRIGSVFIEQQLEVYGGDEEGPHFYSCDTFNENSPPNGDLDYLAEVAQKLYSAMAQADPSAVWVLQDWMWHFNPTNPGFWTKPRIGAFLDAVPDERLLVLDLHSDAFPLRARTDSFRGKPWVWCYLHSFGGRQAMFGNLDRLAEDPPAALRAPDSEGLIGFGLTPEGIEQNPVLYDLATDMMWRSDPPDLSTWLKGYLRRRYAAENQAADDAWEVLRKTVYARPVECGATVVTPVNCAPGLNGYSVALSYPPETLMQAWEHLADAAPALKESDAFGFDLVDVARQVLVNTAAELQQRAAAAFLAGNAPAFRAEGRRMVELILDLDELLGTRREFLLGRWLEAAKAWATNDAERRLLEENARRQITLWGDESSMLRDYGRKDWSGMMRAFYAVRWQRFFDAAAASIDQGTPFDDRAFHRELRQWEEQWIHQTELFPTEPAGDSVRLAAALLPKYRALFAELFVPARSLSTHRPATASESRPGQGPELAVTGVPKRYACWAAEGPQWWQVDLEAVTEVDAVHLFTHWDGQRSYQYAIQTSRDGIDWSPAVDAMDNAVASTPAGTIHHFEPRPARLVRVHVKSNSSNQFAHLLDVRVHGPACPLETDAPGA